MNRSRAHLIIEGRVQGVFYRSTARDKAQSLGLYGWIRNNPDGTVESIVEGDKLKIEEFIEWAHHGSSSAKVQNVSVDWQDDKGEFSTFSVKRY